MRGNINESIYIFFALGIVLGISLAVYYFMNREEKIESQSQKIIY